MGHGGCAGRTAGQRAAGGVAPSALYPANGDRRAAEYPVVVRRLPALAILLLAIGTPFMAACTDQSGSSGPDMMSVGFGTGGSECSLTDTGSTFPHGVPIRTVLEMSPALPTGGTVTVKLEKDGIELVEARQTISVTEPAPCVWGTLPDLDVGHYRMTYGTSPGQMAPVSGEFDVTATESTLSPTDSTSDAPSPTRDPSLATRIIGRIDALAELAVTDDELLTAQWAIDESEWVTQNMSALDQDGTLRLYVDELTAMLETVAEGADHAPVVDRILSLRDKIATEFALPTLAPTPTSEPS